MTEHNNGNNGEKAENNPNVGGIFDGVANLIGRLGELAEKGEMLRKQGEFGDQSKDAVGSYDFSVRVGSASPPTRNSPQVKPVNTPQKPTGPRKSEIVREAHVDILEEGRQIVLIAEMPGVATEDIKVEVNGHELFFTGASRSIRFENKVELKQEIKQENIQVEANNGLMEIRIDLGQESQE